MGSSDRRNEFGDQFPCNFLLLCQTGQKIVLVLIGVQEILSIFGKGMRRPRGLLNDLIDW